MSGNSRATAEQMLEEGLRCQKAGLFREAIELYKEARNHATEEAVVARAWRLQAFAHHSLGEWSEALAAAERSEGIAREIGRSDLLAEALNAHAAVHYARAEFKEAARLYELMLETTTDPRVLGLALQNLAIIHSRRGDLDRAQTQLDAAHDCFQEAGYAWGQAHVLNNLAGIALDRGEYGAAEGASRRAMDVAREVDDLDLLAIATLNMAESLAGLGQLEGAETEASTALGQFQRSGNVWRRVACYRLLGDVHERQGDRELAERCWRSGLQVALEIGAEEEASDLRRRLAEGEAAAGPA